MEGYQVNYSYQKKQQAAPNPKKHRAPIILILHVQGEQQSHIKAASQMWQGTHRKSSVWWCH